MPFVNRYDEVFELLQANIGAHLALMNGRVVVNYRSMDVCFGAQMFGSGKTTLGENFIAALNDSNVASHFETRLSDSNPDYVRLFHREWALAKEATPLFVDIRALGEFREIPRRIAACAGIDNASTLGFADTVMLAAAKQKTALFVHIDEIGNLPVSDLRKLRDGVVATWQHMNSISLAEHDMPRIYFFLSGKGVSLASLGGGTSPVGSRWIILDMLQTEHVSAIRQHLQLLKTNPLQLKVCFGWLLVCLCLCSGSLVRCFSFWSGHVLCSPFECGSFSMWLLTTAA